MESLSNNWQKSESFSFRFPPMAELEFFCLKRYAFPKKVFHDTSNTVLAVLWKILHQVFGILPVKVRKQRFIEIHFFWKINMLILIITLWTCRIQLSKPLQNFYTGFWNFVCQNPKKNWWEYILIQSEKLQLWRSTRQI